VPKSGGSNFEFCHFCQSGKHNADSCHRMGVDFAPMMLDTWGGLHGAGRAMVKAVFNRCTTSVPPGGGNTLSEPFCTIVAHHLESVSKVTTEPPVWGPVARVGVFLFFCQKNSCFLLPILQTRCFFGHIKFLLKQLEKKTTQKIYSAFSRSGLIDGGLIWGGVTVRQSLQE